MMRWNRVVGVVSAAAVACLIACGASCTSSERAGAGARGTAPPPVGAGGWDESSLAGAPVEAVSFLGLPLRAPILEPGVRAAHEWNLERAERDYRRDPEDELNIVWYGRRLAYLGRYRDAVEVFSRGLDVRPESIRLLRHRGHRWITLRELDKAIADLSLAGRLIVERNTPDEIEPDGIPNREDRPRSSTNANVFYHLGLAHYLNHDFDAARDAYMLCLQFAKTSDDMLVATVYWLYHTYRRQGRDAVASALLDTTLRPEMDIIENHAYYEMLRMYRGERTPRELPDRVGARSLDDATIAYGLANWHRVNGDLDWAVDRCRAIVESPQWAAFGFIAAEADLATLIEDGAVQVRPVKIGP